MTKPKFQTHCEQLIKKLSKDKVEEFRTITDDASRTKFVYALSNEVKYDLATWTPKDLERAEALKVSGNKLFHQRCNYQALCVYNEAITRCPQDDSKQKIHKNYLRLCIVLLLSLLRLCMFCLVKGKKLYAILIANRSAVFFDTSMYQKVLQDVAFLKQYGHHPNPDKLTARETKALDALCKSTDSAVIEFEEDGRVKSAPCEEFTWCSKNITYPALSSRLIVKKDNILGRYVVAKDDFQAGEIVGVEKAYAAVLNSNIYRTNCGYCAISTNQVFACPKCCQVVYCNMQCLEKAKIYHQHECSILLTLYDADVSVNNLLALRMITQRPLEQVIKEDTYAKEERNVVIYKTEDYYNVNRLVRHEDVRDPEELLHLTIMAAFLLNLLKTTDYFSKKSENNELTDDEILVGGLLLRYLQILQYNAHEIFELKNADFPQRKITSGEPINYQTGGVGAGLYPTLALLNHSCDPSVIR